MSHSTLLDTVAIVGVLGVIAGYFLKKWGNAKFNKALKPIGWEFVKFEGTTDIFRKLRPDADVAELKAKLKSMTSAYPEVSESIPEPTESHEHRAHFKY